VIAGHLIGKPRKTLAPVVTIPSHVNRDGIVTVAGTSAQRILRYALAMDDPATLSDDALIAAYQRTDGTPGDAAADALAAEIERRGLDL